MDDRICGTCRHFEWATQPGRGWCRNPRLYTANQSQPVSEFELSCATRQGDFWEASEDYAAGQPAARAEPEAPLVRSFEYDEHEVPSGGGQMRGSSADQPRSSDDPGYQQSDVTPPRGSRPSSGGSERVPPPPAGTMGSTAGGGDRPSGYQTEERYWTDYLRIALPIAGLLLLLSVFWYWASSFIGDDNESTPTAVVAVNLTPPGAPTLTPTLEAVQVLNTPTTGAAQPTQAPAQPTQAPAEPTQAPAEPTQAPSEPTTASSTGAFQEGDLVIVNDNDVNMRAEASTTADVVDTLTQGTELRILSGTPQEFTDPADGTTYTYWNVSDDAAGVQGWVVGDYLEK
jgi:hypothetical protein